MLTIRKKCLALVFALSSGLVMQSSAATLTDNFTTGPGSSWSKANWTNGSPFGCSFTTSTSYITPHTYNGATGTSIFSDATYCGELYTGNNYTYGTLSTKMLVVNTKGTVGSAFMISGGSGQAGTTSPWEEMDVEVLPSYTGRVHFAVIYQAYNGNNWGTSYGEKIYDSYPVNPVAIGTAGTYNIVWSTTSIKFYAGGNVLWTINKGSGSPTCATMVGGTTTAPTCYIPTAYWPVSAKSIRLNAWSGDGSAWPGTFTTGTKGGAWYDYVYYK